MEQTTQSIEIERPNLYIKTPFGRVVLDTAIRSKSIFSYVKYTVDYLLPNEKGEQHRKRKTTVDGLIALDEVDEVYLNDEKVYLDRSYVTMLLACNASVEIIPGIELYKHVNGTISLRNKLYKNYYWRIELNEAAKKDKTTELSVNIRAGELGEILGLDEFTKKFENKRVDYDEVKDKIYGSLACEKESNTNQIRFFRVKVKDLACIRYKLRNSDGPSISFMETVLYNGNPWNIGNSISMPYFIVQTFPVNSYEHKKFEDSEVYLGIGHFKEHIWIY